MTWKNHRGRNVNKHTGKIAAIAGLVLLAGIASAKDDFHWRKDGYIGGRPDTCVADVSCVASVPEIDPAATIGAVTLLLGGLLVLRGRKANE
jgi:hypothetical protein